MINNNNNTEDLAILINKLDEQVEYVINVINEITPISKQIESTVRSHEKDIKYNREYLHNLDKEILSLKKITKLIVAAFGFTIIFSLAYTGYVGSTLNAFSDFKYEINNRVDQVEYYIDDLKTKDKLKTKQIIKD